jgi:hypothetical protein
MSSSTITTIFFLGGITFLADLFLFIKLKVADNSTLQNSMMFLKIYILSVLGVLSSGVLFVSLFMVAHG